MERSWRWIYVVCAVLALYLNVFVAVVRSFTKITTVHALARTQKETLFLVMQLVVIMIFVVIGIFAVKKFHIKPVSAPAARKSSKAS